MMKTKKILIGVSLVFIATFTLRNIQGNPFSDYGKLALANIEALAAEEADGITTGDHVSFTFHGQNWYGTKSASSSHWFPKYQTCSSGSFDGHKVVCDLGDGNCVNGTSCY